MPDLSTLLLLWLVPGGEQTEAMKARKAQLDDKNRGKSTGQVALVFGAAALATLAAGVALEQSGDGLAQHLHMTGVLFGATVLAQAHRTDIYLAGLGVLLTTVYIYGLVFRPRRLFLHMGADSLIVLYALGIAGLFTIAN